MGCVWFPACQSSPRQPPGLPLTCRPTQPTSRLRTEPQTELCQNNCQASSFAIWGELGSRTLQERVAAAPASGAVSRPNPGTAPPGWVPARFSPCQSLSPFGFILCSLLLLTFRRSFRRPHTFLWRRKWQPTPVFLPGESHGRGSLAGYSPWGCKESDTTEHRARAHPFLFPSSKDSCVIESFVTAESPKLQASERRSLERRREHLN